VRSRQTINTITKVTAELLKLLKELEAPAFALAITKSDRRERKDTLKKLTKLVSTFEVIREKLPAAEEAAKVAAKELKTFIDQKR
jgi:selenocysteine-specific translation elongation factor